MRGPDFIRTGSPRTPTASAVSKKYQTPSSKDSQLMEADVAAVAGPKGRTIGSGWPSRHGTGSGSGSGSGTLGGQRVPVQRPRVRAADGSGELPVPAYELFCSTELLGRLAMEKMLAGLSTRR